MYGSNIGVSKGEIRILDYSSKELNFSHGEERPADNPQPEATLKFKNIP